MRKTFRTRILLPISTEPIENAFFSVDSAGRIAAFGKAQDFSGPTCDLGDTLVLPAFVNAHSHLEFGAARGLKRRGGFSEWIEDILTWRKNATPRQITAGVRHAAESLWQSGVGIIADHTSPDGPIAQILQTPFSGRLFIEILGAAHDVALAHLAMGKRVSAQHPSPRSWQIHLSPHSVHGLNPTILGKVLSADGLSAFFSLHLAESDEERRTFDTHDGPLAAFIAARSPLPETWRGSAIQTLRDADLLQHPMLIVHGNTATDADLRALAPSRHAFVHCPGSHRYFDHPPFPLEKIERAGFTVAIGTDSWASNLHQNFIEELRIFAQTFPAKTPANIIRHATLTGAKAMGLGRDFGSIEIGKRAALIGFSYRSGDPHESILGENAISWRLESHC